jgi:hypothetical protein
MDDLLGHLQVALWSFLGKAADFCLELLIAAGRKALELTGGLAGYIEALAARLAAVPLWLSLPAAALLLALVVCYLLRQRLYDRVLVYHLVWLRRQGFSRQTFRVRRGAVRKSRTAMARRIELPARFATIAIYEVHPDHYAVAYGQTAGLAEDVRFYRRDLRAGLLAMAEDLMAFFRETIRLLHADSELRALFVVLDARDPGFRACRPLLPGEVGKRAAPDQAGTARETAFGRSTGSGAGV